MLFLCMILYGQGGWKVKATDCKSVFYEFESHPCLDKKGSVEQLAGWPTVNRVSPEHAVPVSGLPRHSSPAASTTQYRDNDQGFRLSPGNLFCFGRTGTADWEDNDGWFIPINREGCSACAELISVFESCFPDNIIHAGMAKLANAPDLGSGSWEFESLLPYNSDLWCNG